MYRCAATFVLICVATLLANGQQRSTAPTSHVVSQGGAEVPSLPGFRIDEALDSAGGIRQLLVYRDGQQIQSLDVCTSKPVLRTGELGGIVVGNFDFDGYPDLAMLVSLVDDNRTFCIWLFSPQTQRFIFSQQLSGLINPSPDPSTKTVVTYKNEDCAGGCYERDTYVWSGHKLVPVQYETQDDDPTLPVTEDCRFVRTLKREKNGRMVEVSRDRVNSAEVRCVPSPI